MGLVRAAVVGVGHLGRFHAEKYAELEGVELVGVVDSDRPRAEKIAAELGTRVFDDHRALVGAVDCASIAVPTRAHAEVACDLLEGGVDVLVEKPLASTRLEGETLVRLATTTGRVLQVGHLERFNPAFKLAAEVVTCSAADCTLSRGVCEPLLSPPILGSIAHGFFCRFFRRRDRSRRSSSLRTRPQDLRE